MKNKKPILLLLLIYTAISSGCNFPLNDKDSSAEEEIISLATQVAQTMTAFEAQLQQTQTYLDENPTPTVMPTIEVPAQTQPTVPAASSNSQAGCLIAGTVSETIPDDTTFVPKYPLTKTWKVINSGSCAWTTNYQLVFLSGEQMGGISPLNLGSNVPAGNIIDLSLALVAPTAPGTYRGDWALQDENGNIVAVFWVQIIVKDPGPFAITTATLSSTQNYTGVCPYTYSINADITANTFGSATYYFVYEDGSKSTPATLDFPYASTLKVTGSRILKATGPSYSAKLYIDSPNHQDFGSTTLALVCN